MVKDVRHDGQRVGAVSTPERGEAIGLYSDVEEILFEYDDSWEAFVVEFEPDEVVAVGEEDEIVAAAIVEDAEYRDEVVAVAERASR